MARLMIQNRSQRTYPAWAIIEKRGNKLALLGGEVPIFWLRKVAQARADEYNNGGNYVCVEKITIHRMKKR